LSLFSSFYNTLAPFANSKLAFPEKKRKRRGGAERAGERDGGRKRERERRLLSTALL